MLLGGGCSDLPHVIPSIVRGRGYWTSVSYGCFRIARRRFLNKAVFSRALISHSLHPGLQVSFIYDGLANRGVARPAIKLGRQLVFFNELFGWARIAFIALADGPPPDILYGPSPGGTLPVPSDVPQTRAVIVGGTLWAIIFMTDYSITVVTHTLLPLLD